MTLAVFVALLWRRDVPPDLLFWGGLLILVLLGVLPVQSALAGFSNPAVLTIAALFVVAAGLNSTGVLDWIGHRLLGTANTADIALRRLATSVVPLSAFINNTPVVAMFVPVILDWCRRRGVAPSRILIPLSYLAILGGVCTLIGTSTNVVSNGLLKEEQTIANVQHRYSPAFRAQLRDMTLFELGWVGIPCAAIGTLYLLLFGRRLLPDRTGLVDQFGAERREYLVEMQVQPECHLIGKTVEEAGLRHLRGLFLIEIDRADEVLTPVTPHDVIRDGDRLVFTGVVTTIVDLVKIPGLVPAADTNYDVHPHRRRQRHLCEAVISRSSPLIGTTVREAKFRQFYNAAVVAVHRNGERVPSKVGDIVLEPGDTLLLQTRTGFADRYRHSRDFCLVAGVEGSQPRRRERAWLALGLLGLLILWLSLEGWVPEGGAWAGLASPAVAAMVVAGVMIAARCLPMSEARAAVDLQVLMTIVAALGLGRALTESGAAHSLAELLLAGIGTHSPYQLLIVLYLLALVFTEMITNSAVVAMLFPLAVATAATAGYSPRPFVMAITLAASLSFLTPIGYQTNLMVMGPGRYQPRDFFRIGWPLTLLTAIVAVILIPWVWPFAL
ncbi:MAG: SLC13 family permease [Thermoguttaceae bacterium]